jgi:hypothetical protein
MENLKSITSIPSDIPAKQLIIRRLTGTVGFFRPLGSAEESYLSTTSSRATYIHSSTLALSAD